jgi:hypothetical protein
VEASDPQIVERVEARRAPLSRFGAPLVYLAGALVLWRHFNFIYYKDEIPVLSAAAWFARGQLEAVNSYWAPLLSMEHAPLLAAGFAPERAADVVKILNGLMALQGGRALLRTMLVRGWLLVLWDLVLVAVTLYCTMPAPSADVLVTGILAWYFSVVFRSDFPSRRWAGLLAGVLGGLAYYAKVYAFFFFVPHYLLVNAGHYLAGDADVRAKLWRQLRLGYLAFAALVVIWVGALGAKYHVVTLGITGKYNYQIVGPEAVDRPIVQIGFDAEPRPGNTSVWDDPADFYRVPSAVACCLKPWSPLSSARAFRHQLGLIRSNLANALEAFRSFSMFSFTVIVLCALMSVFTREDARRHLPIVLSLVTLALYPLGYLLVFTDERYLWPMLFLLIAMSGYLLTIAFSSSLLRDRPRQILVAALLALSFVKIPVAGIRKARDFGRYTSQYVAALRDTDLHGKRLASNTDYAASDIIAYYQSAKYLGQKRSRIPSPDSLRAELKRARIDYYLVWGGLARDSVPAGLSLVRTVDVASPQGGLTNRLSILAVE